ncbi:hypothetical protein AWM70_00370 [Paenibacillus yonginensis]|uniref:DUF2536 domain-containing protein n=2 Tax=Paenibacillus TaxID=44249 RepID=A0A1B1MVQ8_9BACL|nr:MULTISPECIES: DUF2536 family protein [Paenibacillus]ANS73227.1 hypothetical protein AWM70_00370 [Paenibacillus yonginensis]GGA26133.1 hypothetical protein GCM10010917_08720 [Paenibacillus physcomitrellae]
MNITLDTIQDKVEFFQAYDLKVLEKTIEERIDINKALMLKVHSVQHQAAFDPVRNQLQYSAVVHFKA